ncbi:phosphatase PAP2 family protein [Devriesea agamarum]|uniref:phosphatase PAP2 family protein n=1 Tax=Devriesea agamarum TaxID=472569 RepID=UPI00071E124E|nr:phosphatase PAP2 family protein [Devriesea agamarum]
MKGRIATGWGSFALCLACLVGVSLLAGTSIDTAGGQRLDQLVLSGARGDDGLISRIVFPVLNTVSIPFILVALVVTVLVALLRRRYGLAWSMLVLVLGSNATTQVLKKIVIERPHLVAGIDVTPNSFPSGHTTVAASVAIAFAVVAPTTLRPLVSILGAFFTILTGIGTMTGGWHRPSDVVGAFLVVAAWTFGFLASEALMAWQQPPQQPPHERVQARQGCYPRTRNRKIHQCRRTHQRHPESPQSSPADSCRSISRGHLHVERWMRTNAWLLRGLAAVGAVSLASGVALIGALPQSLPLNDVAVQSRAYLGACAGICGLWCLTMWATTRLRKILDPPPSQTIVLRHRVP